MRLFDPAIPAGVPVGMTRRHWLKHLALSAMAVPAMQCTRLLAAHASKLQKQGKSVILLWMGGGPATIDIWDMKPGTSTGGEFTPIATSVPGIQISEHLPRIASQMHNLSIIRSMSTREADHSRGTYKMHTGYIPNPTMQHPSFGAVTAYELGPKLSDFDLPHFINIASQDTGPGFLGMAHAPFAVQNPGAPIQNLQVPRGLAGFRLQNRFGLLAALDDRFDRQRRGRAAQDHRDVYEKTVRMMNSRQLDAFNLDKESSSVRDKYGNTNFGRGCLMARRLVEIGVTFVEVGLGGWDTHNRNFERQRDDLQPTLDQGMGALLEDLEQRGLLDKTLIVWMGDFGRTPRINQDAGRDHWARCWSVVLGGCGIRGGQVIGSTDSTGMAVADRPLDIPQLLATCYAALDIPVDRKYMTPNGRPYWVVNRDANAQPIAELIG